MRGKHRNRHNTWVAEKKYTRLSCEDPNLKISPLGASIKRGSRKQPKGNSGPVTDSASCPHLFGFMALHAASQVGKCIKQSHPISGQEDTQKETTMKPVMEMAGAYPAEIKASRREPGLPLYKILLGFSTQHPEKVLGREFWTTS